MNGLASMRLFRLLHRFGPAWHPYMEAEFHLRPPRHGFVLKLQIEIPD
jgi:hypothetical protein